jgi:hypothetical protein
MVLELVEGSCGRAKFRNSLPGASLGASFPLLTSQPLGLADRALALSDRLTGPHFDVGAPPRLPQVVYQPSHLNLHLP